MKPPFVYDAVSVTYLHKNGERFFESFRIVREKGFKEKIDGDDIVTKPIPEKGSTVAVDSFSVYDMETKPPSVYTTGSLILAMEKAGKLIEDEELREQIKTNGIGTSATRAGIIEKLSAPDKNGISFITIDSKTQKVAPTEFGKKIVIPSDRERQIFEMKTTNYYSENRTVRKSVCPSKIQKKGTNTIVVGNNSHNHFVSSLPNAECSSIVDDTGKSEKICSHALEQKGYAVYSSTGQNY